MLAVLAGDRLGLELGGQGSLICAGYHLKPI